jgi:amidohydrolase
VDAVVAAAHVVLGLQTALSRRCDPLAPLVLTVGAITGGAARNVLAETVSLVGSLRSFSEESRAQALRAIEDAASAAAATVGAQARVRLIGGTPSVVNDALVTQAALRIAEELLGSERVAQAPLIPHSEDFGEYAQRVPCCFGLLGVRSAAAGAVHPVHTPRFRLDEAALPIGVSLLAAFGARLGAASDLPHGAPMRG